ncbi:MAG: malto-oligosyltrehalose synthase [Chlamydiales bacterium]|nr:malto-oligosyltrehalose synthase [Chlamydiales bacterium]
MEKMLEREIAQVADELLKKSFVPSAVYRLQMNADFPFLKAAELAPYLKELGIEALYASPYFEAVPESTHGYDVIAPNRLNPELGTDADFDAFCSALSDAGMGHILDFVANHMSASCYNPWWVDVLKKGPDSEYAEYFDIAPGKKIRLPILKRGLHEAIEQGEVVRDGNWIVVDVHRLPLKESSNLSKPLDKLLDEQHYELCDWKEGGSYRRFFDITQLAAIRQENPEVFAHYHQLALELALQGKIQGMRIDHPDGLYEPVRYFDDLQALYFLEKLIHEIEHRYPGKEVDVDVCLKVISKIDLNQKKPLYLLAEKILHDDEELPEELSVHGTVGYDFLVRLSGLFVKSDEEKEMDRIYAEYSHEITPPEEMLYHLKKTFLLTHMVGELKQLTGCFERDYEKQLIELLASFPVYRTYINHHISKRDSAILSRAFEDAQKRAPDLDFDSLKEIFFKGLNPEGVSRFQQLSAPLMAKGQEDTMFYIYNRLICLNEVGGNPMRFGTNIEEFHRHNQYRLKHWPYGLISTDTHDTKRSMDVRMRIAALTELTSDWEAFIKAAPEAPDPNFGYLFYQTLLGVYEPDAKNLEQRLIDYSMKAAKEAKVHTSWSQPNIAFEEAIEEFVKRALKHAPFHTLWEKVDALGKQNSLSALILQIGAPGVFDLYQGSELWKYNLVDPDNRAPVDFELRQKLLHKGGHPKLAILSKGLNFRKEHKDLILNGSYIPLKTPSEHTVAFAREKNGQRIIVAARRLFSEDACIGFTSPPGWDGPWQDIFTGKPYKKELFDQGCLLIQSHI